ncbi:YhcN/YlaJ family sporulation lipoprotein [Clostridium sp.]|uniref:YhcN/YlaJ family sporulation lipoprotein n=1 Tax=Clostridium sp. TaxID=1506 RepID=UPI003216ABD5
MKLKIQKMLVFTFVILIIATVILIGCNKDKKSGDTTGAGPTIEDMDNNPIDKDETIKDAIATCERVMDKVQLIDGIESAVVFINHESVLVALKLEENYESITSTLKNEINIKVKEVYPKAKTIAISKDEYVYESISRLLKGFKEDKPIDELKRDIEQIIKDM